MDFITVVMIALGLSMDAFAVSVSNGMCYRDIHKKEVVCTALAFGVFQMGMPVIGYFAGRSFSEAVAFMDHWIALLLLGIIGGKMVWDGLREMKQPASCPRQKTFTWKILVLQAVATSIDALAVGLSFAMMRVSIWSAAAVIGGVTFLCCLLGGVLGKTCGAFLKNKAEILGGILLVGIGLKIFAEHMLAL